MHHLLQGIRHVLKSRYNLISISALHEKGFNFSSTGDLIEVFKDAQVKFQAERLSNVYILRNLKVTVDALQLSSASRSEVVE